MYIENKSSKEVEIICMDFREKNILFYDAIAAEYDEQLKNDKKNIYVRELVAKKFIQVAKARLVLDFGGGTGQDLEWLLKHQYQIIFCEPSKAMRQIARGRESLKFPDSAIIFFENEQADFRKWTDSFPFEQKVDAVLANFAVLNCIREIDELFNKLAIALKPGGHVIALVLDDHIINYLQSQPLSTIRSLIFGGPIRLFVNHNMHQQEVYVHSIRNIRNACKRKFDLISGVRLKDYGFRLIHLIRK
jgi:SAM-dependent methyltransferase